MLEAPRLYADRCVDERRIPFFEREAKLEAAFLAIRTAHTSRLFADSTKTGAFAVFPVVLYGLFKKYSGCGAAGQQAINVAIEPGTLFPLGSTRVDWTLNTTDSTITGYFTVTVSRAKRVPSPGKATCIVTTADGKRYHVPTPLPSIVLSPRNPSALKAQIAEFDRRDKEARGEILRLTDGLLHQAVSHVRMGFTNLVDADDAYQLAVIELMRLIDRFASPNRPRVSWGRYVMLYTNRAVVRPLEQERHIGRPERALGRLLEQRPDLAGASISKLRAELEKMTPEAKRWSDARIAQAIAGPSRTVSLDQEGYDRAEDKAGADLEDDGELSGDVLVGTILDDPRSLRAARPYLVSRSIISSDHEEQSSPRTVRRSRQALIRAVADRLGIKAETSREFVECFARDGESYDVPSDRQRMSERARMAIKSILEHGYDT